MGMLFEEQVFERALCEEYIDLILRLRRYSERRGSGCTRHGVTFMGGIFVLLGGLLTMYQ